MKYRQWHYWALIVSLGIFGYYLAYTLLSFMFSGLFQ